MQLSHRTAGWYPFLLLYPLNTKCVIKSSILSVTLLTFLVFLQHAEDNVCGESSPQNLPCQFTTKTYFLGGNFYVNSIPQWIVWINQWWRILANFSQSFHFCATFLIILDPKIPICSRLWRLKIKNNCLIYNCSSFSL